MKDKRLFQAMNQVDDRYYQEAATYTCKSRRWGWAAACAVLCLVGTLIAVLPRLTGDTATQLVPASAAPSAAEKQAVTLHVNEISAPSVVTNHIALWGEDYTAMTYEELLDYFQTSLPVSRALPNLTLQEGAYGVYQRDERGTYYDGNAVVFESGDGTQRVQVVLSKVFKHTSDVFQLTGDQLSFTQVKNRNLAVFHYTDEMGQSCYYVEFLQHDVAFQVDGENLSEEEYAQVLEALVDPAQQEETVQTLVGTVTAIDPYTNNLGILLEGENGSPNSRGYGIDLPESLRAEDFALGDRVEVTYTGEPATICTVWAEQFLDIQRMD